VALRHQLNLPDGLHPNRNGHQIISDNIFPYVVQAIHLREQQ
jgi:lysophospholipase L1-like esterase